MIEYIKYLNIPTKITILIVFLFLIIQIIGEILEFKGKVVPEYIKIRKYFLRKKQEREILHQVPITLADVRKSLDEFKTYYSTDNIRMRDDWIENVNYNLKECDERIKKLDEKLDKNNVNTLSMLIENKRNTIIDFASKVVDKNSLVTREQYNRILRLYDEYEKLITENGLTNGEIDIAHHIIMDSYESHMKNHSFIEEMYGFDI